MSNPMANSRQYTNSSDQIIREQENLDDSNSPDDQDNKLLLNSYLHKRSGRTHQWKKRWVVLRNCQLSYYKDSTEHKALKVFSKSNLLSFSTIADNKKFHFAIYTNKKVLHFKSNDEEIYNQWVDVLRQFYEEKSHTDNEAVYNQLMQEKKLRHAALNSFNDAEYSGDEPLSSAGSESTTNGTPRMKGLQSFPQESEQDNEGEFGFTNLNIHDSIRSEDEYILEQGYLLKLRKRYNQWRNFYIILSNKNLYIYKHQDDISHVHKTFPLDDIIDVIELDPLSKTKIWCFLLITPLKRMKFCAIDENDMIKWLSALKTLIKKNQK